MDGDGTVNELDVRKALPHQSRSVTRWTAASASEVIARCDRCDRVASPTPDDDLVAHLCVRSQVFVDVAVTISSFAEEVIVAQTFGTA